MTEWPVIRSVRRLPSGKVEYTLVDEHGNVRRVRALNNVGAYARTQDFLTHVSHLGFRPRGIPRWRDD